MAGTLNYTVSLDIPDNWTTHVYIMPGVNQNETHGHSENGLMGTQSSQDLEPLLKQSPAAIALFTVAYGVVLLLAVINNSLVVTAIQRNQQLRTVTNMFVTNLAVADITVSLLVLPITLLTNLFTGKPRPSSTTSDLILYLTI